MQNFLINKAKNQTQTNSKTSKEGTPVNLSKSHSENKIHVANSRKNSKTDSEFSDFNGFSASNTPVNKSKNFKLSQKEHSKPFSPIKLIKPQDKNLNFKKKEKEMQGYAKKHQEKDQNLKRSLTPTSKNDNSKFIEPKKKTSRIENSQILNNSILSKQKNNTTQEKKINSNNDSSEEEPLHIKISLDLNKFNKNANKIENKNDEKEEENNQFLKNVVKDIDKLTQKMLNTNPNLASLSGLQSFLSFLIFCRK